MRAMVIDEWGGRDARGGRRGAPVGPDFVLIRVRAAGVNPVDAKIRAGHLARCSPRASR